MTTYTVVMRVNESQMAAARKDTVINCLSVALVNAESLVEAHDKAITVFPPDLVGRSTITVNQCSSSALKAIIDSLWEDHAEQMQSNRMVDQLLGK